MIALVEARLDISTASLPLSHSAAVHSLLCVDVATKVDILTLVISFNLLSRPLSISQ